MTHTDLQPQYEITEDGRVFCLWSNWRGYGRRELTQHLNASGYPSVRIYQNGQRKRIAVHSLMAENFLPPRPTPTHEIRHLDGNPKNNNKANLTWGTKADNARDRERHGQTSFGKRHSDAIKRGLEKSARARLIAAAPDLLAALKRCEAMVSTDDGPPDWDWVRAIIAKVEGKQS